MAKGWGGGRRLGGGAGEGRRGETRASAPLAPPIGRDAVDASDAVARGSTHVGEVVVKEKHRAERHPLPRADGWSEADRSLGGLLAPRESESAGIGRRGMCVRAWEREKRGRGGEEGRARRRRRGRRRTVRLWISLRCKGLGPSWMTMGLEPITSAAVRPPGSSLSISSHCRAHAARWVREAMATGTSASESSSSARRLAG